MSRSEAVFPFKKSRARKLEKKVLKHRRPGFRRWMSKSSGGGRRPLPPLPQDCSLEAEKRRSRFYFAMRQRTTQQPLRKNFRAIKKKVPAEAGTLANLVNHCTFNCHAPCP